MKYCYIETLIRNLRTQIMGLAILLIMLSHSVVKYKGWHWGEGGHFILDFGVIGVDLFLLVSGFGLYYSIMSTKGTKAFYKKRLKRILPGYWFVIILYQVISFVHFGFRYKTLCDLIIELTTIGFWLSLFKFSNPYWYISGILFLYIITPFLVRIINDNWNKWRKILLLIVLSAFFVNTIITSFVHGCYYLLFSRVPIFVIGLILGRFSYYHSHVQINKQSICFISIILFLVMWLLCCKYSVFIHYALGYGIVFATFILIIPGLLLLVYYLNCLKLCSSILFFMGSISLELYLCHGLEYRLMSLFGIEHNIAVSILFFIGTIPLAVVLNNAMSISQLIAKSK